MTIIDAIDSAPTEHAVFFLVTAYIESLRHFERGCGVPPGAIELPVAGYGDLAARHDMLQSTPDTVPGDGVAKSEAAAVLAAALARLSALAEPGQTALPAAAMRSARIDNPRSSLSV